MAGRTHWASGVSFLLGADFGTGGAKVALVSDAGEQLGYAFEEYPIHTDGPGWSEHDAPRYWEAFCRLTRKVLAESRVSPAADPRRRRLVGAALGRLHRRGRQRRCRAPTTSWTAAPRRR